MVRIKFYASLPGDWRLSPWLPGRASTGARFLCCTIVGPGDWLGNTKLPCTAVCASGWVKTPNSWKLNHQGSFCSEIRYNTHIQNPDEVPDAKGRIVTWRENDAYVRFMPLLFYWDVNLRLKHCIIAVCRNLLSLIYSVHLRINSLIHFFFFFTPSKRL